MLDSLPAPCVRYWQALQEKSNLQPGGQRAANGASAAVGMDGEVPSWAALRSPPTWRVWGARCPRLAGQVVSQEAPRGVRDVRA